MNGIEISLALIATLGGILATTIGALIWLLKKLFTQSEKTLKEGNLASVALAKAIDKLSASSDEQLRLSRLREKEELRWQALVVKKLEEIDAKVDRNYDATDQNQTVLEQNVAHQTVAESE